MPQIKLEKINDFTWQIPKTYNPDMHVPTVIYADESLLQKMTQDRTLIQGANVATLKGIYKYSIVLPDGHEGYGFPIGGVAAMDATDGVISPGGVGYDINCLTGDSSILTADGFWIKIKDFEKFEKNNTYELLCVDLKNHKIAKTNFFRFIKMLPKGKVYRITTEAGYKITATEDHPFLTPNGMVQLKELKEGDKVAVYPFEGVQYEEPPKKVIIDENLCKIPFTSEYKRKAIIEELKKRNLLPLYMNDKKIAILAKIIGYITGDGTICFVKGKGYVWFYGRREDLKRIREDIKKLGYTASKIYKRTRHHEISTKYGLKEFVSTEYYMKVSSSSFASLLVELGAPIGDKTKVKFEVPSWILESPKWIKRLYLGALFGAELTTPKSVYKYNFYCPVLGINKSKDNAKNGYKFLKQISILLKDFGIKVAKISIRKEGKRKTGEEIVRLRLIISSEPQNLINFFGKIGYIYNEKRNYLSNLACHYLRLKLNIIKKRIQIAKQVKVLKHKERPIEIYNKLVSKYINMRFLERALYENYKTQPRIAQEFISFKEFINNPSFVASDFIWDKIIKKEEVRYFDYVYDFTVNHPDHNFIANNFIVSNCGVRLLVTNLDEKDVRPKLQELMTTLFNNVPSGLGSRRKDFKVTHSTLDRIAIEGAKYIIDNYGLGWSEDIKHIEEEGAMDGADPSKVSPVAKDRGMAQIGTLGSGNHFLEVQRVDKIFNREVAKAFGITHENQITVMIHTGSRGYGHQICSDYLKVMERAIHRYNIKIPDRELACAPASSPEAEQYFSAMACAVNYAFANRQAITHWVRQSFERVFNTSADKLGMKLVYDVAHNIAKLEEHRVNGERKKVYVHRKGATRAFPPNHPQIPADYRSVGQPVIIPGSMGTASWLLVGTEKAMDLSFGSTAHGAGREMSRAGAKRQLTASYVEESLRRKGIVARAASKAVLVEEADESYKNVDKVVEVSHNVGIALKVARLVPIGVAKG